MVRLPVLESLRISNYGLFPGSHPEEPGLNITFAPGLTLILGANGLGKTTLITILYRLLTGPYDIPALAGRGNLGNASLKPSLLAPNTRRALSQRVTDRARSSSATLTLLLGETRLVITRTLSDLSLQALALDDTELGVDEIRDFQGTITRLAGLSSFGDWILLLHHVVFYFEDRRALVWDPSAQRQLLRALFLSPEIAEEWTDTERTILELDSRTRNLGATLFREEQSIGRTEAKLSAYPNLKLDIEKLEAEQLTDGERRDGLGVDLLDLEGQREQARLRLLSAEQERESRLRELERTKLSVIRAHFPNLAASSHYVLAQLLAESECLVCGSHVPAAASEYAARIARGACVVCNTSLRDSRRVGDGQSVPVADEAIASEAQALEDAEREIQEATAALADATRAHAKNVEEYAHISARMADRRNHLEALLRELPPEEAGIRQQRSELAALRNRLNELRVSLADQRRDFHTFVSAITRDLAQRADEIRGQFDDYAQGFLLEQCRLVWSPQKSTLGQGGIVFDFPAFELELTGTDFALPVRRSGPDQVSESQREFIDLAFRMALISVSSPDGAGSIVIDAPESSLDAVFAPRAAGVLTRFAASSDRARLVLASNLIEGQLIPSLISRTVTQATRQQRIVDLLTVATPTAAVKALAEEYAALRDRTLAQIPTSA